MLINTQPLHFFNITKNKRSPLFDYLNVLTLFFLDTNQITVFEDTKIIVFRWMSELYCNSDTFFLPQQSVH